MNDTDAELAELKAKVTALEGRLAKTEDALAELAMFRALMRDVRKDLGLSEWPHMEAHEIAKLADMISGPAAENH
jgi:hypothetical protein